MKILLIGEYSGLHNTLAEGLAKLGHEAVIISSGDGFKKYATNYSFGASWFRKPLLHKANKGFIKFFGTDLSRMEQAWHFYRLLPKLKGFNHIQLINSDALETAPWLAKLLLEKLLKQNNCTISLLVCGDETPVIAYALSGKLKYSILTPYLNDTSLKKQFSYSLKYIEKGHRQLFNWIVLRAQSIITSDLDYEIPMQAMGYTTHFIANPVNTDKITPNQPEVKDKVIIFLGINRLSYVKKGITFFEQALEQIRKKYADKVEIIVTENVPYQEYINLYNRAHILLDQVYAYDQGYNALEAMAKGKVVFTGAETEFYAHYNLTEPVNINALPNVDSLVTSLSYLIENPAEITAIGKRAKDFIEQEHNYVKVAEKYVSVWTEQSTR
ncbi:glycosyltransferase [Flavobacterium sp. RHBU_3]|uniref:glycosyltransferase family protein n=1 Tax=Flavobacterium sp. RHBU_3 TaxID=3391184 RepID=UPI0039850431